MGKELNIDWSKFKSNSKGKILEKAKQGYIEFCRMLNEVDFELVGDYIGAKGKVELKYKFNNIKLSVKPNNFKTTYKAIVNFKSKLKENNDEFIKFACLTNSGNFIANIQTIDGGVVEIDIRNYSSFTKARQDFYDKLKEINGYTSNFYIDNKIKMNICVDDVKLNPISPNVFKRQTYKAIINFKNKLIKNGDKFIKFVSLNGQGNLIAKIKIADKSFINLDIGSYNHWNKSRKDTYKYCKEKGYKILSSYISTRDKILIDFNCGHKPNWTIPHTLKNNHGCPVCDESKGEKYIREYLEDKGVNFKQEYRFQDCKHKRSLPFDFYVPSLNLCIEYDGVQHFETNEYFGGKSVFEDTQNRDNIKNKYCKENGICLLRIPYYELDEIENILDEEFDRFRKLAQ